MANEKTIYLHIGTPKTGTTSIQEYLESHYDNLYKDGYLVPKTSRRHKPNHTLLTNYCINKKRITAISIRNGMHTNKELKKFRRDFYKELRNEIKQFPGEYVVFSNEQCYGRLSSVDELRKLKDLFDGLFNQMKIIVYIREQTDMACSFYSSKIKNGKTYLIDSLSEFKQNELYDYSQKLKMWEEVFGIENIALRVFDKNKLYENDIISDFCEVINLPRYNYEPIFSNTKLNAKQCEYLRIVNEYIPFFIDNRVNEKRAGLRDLIADTDVDSPDITNFISRDYQNVYDDSNNELAKRYFGETTPLFHKKQINDQAQDQTIILTQEDKKTITTQIIQRHKNQNEMLCKCIAAIFEIEYENKKISMDYVYSHHPNGQDEEKSKKYNKFLQLFENKRSELIKRI